MQGYASERQVVVGLACGWWLCWSVALLLSLSLPLWPQAVRDGWFYGTGEWVTLWLLAYAAWYRRDQAAGNASMLWHRVALAILIWLISSLVGSLALLVDGSLFWFIEDCGYAFYYLLLNSTLNRGFGRRVWLNFSNAFILMLFGYAIVLPAMLAPLEYDSWQPSYAFYLALDIYLLQRVWRLPASAVWSLEHSRQLTLMLTLILLGDAFDGAWLIGWLPDSSEQVFAGIYFLPLLAASVLLRQSITAPQWFSAPASVAALPLNWLALVSLPILVHLLGYAMADFDASLRNVRDAYLAAWLLIVTVILAWRQLQERSPASNNEPAPEQQMADELLGRLDEVLARRQSQTNLRVADVADDLAMRPRQLQRKLKALTGKTPEQYWLDWRLDKAAELLAEGGKVAYVAQATGFSQQSHFSRRFKMRFAVTPGEYIKQRRSTLASNPTTTS